METPLKFRAPGITLALGLGIGRLVFYVLNTLEICLAILMIFSFLKIKPRGKMPIACFGVIAVLLLLETVWLLPVLDARAEAVINGDEMPVSIAHFIYIAFDAIKLVLLFMLGTSLLKQNLRVE